MESTSTPDQPIRILSGANPAPLPFQEREFSFQMSASPRGLPFLPREARESAPIGYQVAFLAAGFVLFGAVVAGLAFSVGLWNRAPGIAIDHRALAEEWNLQNKWELAAEEFFSAEVVDPLDIESIAKMGRALAMAGDRDGEIEAYRRARSRAPRNPQIHNLLGKAHFEAGRYDDALGCYREALWLDPHLAEACVNVGAIWSVRGDLESAETEFRKALQLNPGLAEAHNGLGAVLARTGRLAEAEKSFAEAVRLNPALASAQRNLDHVRRELALAAQEGTPSAP